MLILTRKLGEKITIGDEIEITVTEIKDKQVRIGIDAPKRLAVHRKEIKDRIDKENDYSDYPMCPCHDKEVK